MNDFPREILPWYRLILFEQTPQLHKYLSSYSWKEIIFPFYLRLKCLDHIFFLSPQQAYTATARLHVILKWFWLQSLNDCGLWETHNFFLSKTNFRYSKFIATIKTKYLLQKKLNLGTEFTQTTESYKYGKHKLPLF